MHDGVWDKSAEGSHEVRGRTLGIVGYGNIGTQLSNLAEALGLRVIFFDTADRLAHGNARRMSTLDELLAEADVVSLHVDGRPGNAGFFGAEQFAKMKPRSLFINAARGMVVDTESLREHILSGHIAGAALDVFPVEPKAQGDAFESALRGLDNVILTPHVGGSTQEAQEEIGYFVAGKLAGFVARGPHRAVGEPAGRPGPAARAAATGSATCTTTSPGCSPASTGCSPTPAPTCIGAVPLHPRRAGVRRHRHRRARCPQDALDRLRSMPHTLRMRTCSRLTPGTRARPAWPGRARWPA